MYATCLYCHHALGANDQVEAFPVGRRLAFDAAKGRLWVVCGSCGRWNLAPLDERWEAIEQCERLFSATRIRVSTDQIGLAKLRDGTELVRIGDPLRPEFAAWRYTDHIQRRRRRNLIVAGAGVLGMTAVGAGAWAAGLGFGVVNILRLTHTAVQKRRDKRIVYRGEPGAPRLTAGDLDRLVLRVPGKESPTSVMGLELHPDEGKRESWAHLDRRRTVLGGDATLPVAALALARKNRMAGKAAEITSAVNLIERIGNPFRDAGIHPDWVLAHRRRGSGPIPSAKDQLLMLSDLDTTARLALEMAAHEEQERLFLSAHLSVLEHAWKEAEEIAAIADDLLLPDWIRQRIGG